MAVSEQQPCRSAEGLSSMAYTGALTGYSTVNDCHGPSGWSRSHFCFMFCCVELATCELLMWEGNPAVEGLLTHFDYPFDSWNATLAELSIFIWYAVWCFNKQFLLINQKLTILRSNITASFALLSQCAKHWSILVLVTQQLKNFNTVGKIFWKNLCSGASTPQVNNAYCIFPLFPKIHKFSP